MFKKNLLSEYINHIREIEVDDLEHRRCLNFFINNMEKHFKDEITNRVGIRSWHSFFELLINTSVKSDADFNQLNPGIEALFQLRNTIAHGRQIEYYSVKKSPQNDIEEGNNIEAISRYLEGKNLLKTKSESVHPLDDVFSDEVIDHFARIVKEYKEKVNKFIENRFKYMACYTEENALKEFEEKWKKSKNELNTN